MEKINMIEYFMRKEGLDKKAAGEKLDQINKENKDTWWDIYHEWDRLDRRRNTLDRSNGTFQEFFAYSNYLTDQEAEEQLQRMKAEDPDQYQEIVDEYESWEPRFKIHKVQMELTDEEWEYLRSKAAERDQGAGKLLETFVKDLYGERRQGSDEEMLACQWYDRGSCNY